MLRLRVDVLDRAGEPLILTVSFLKKIEVNPTLLLSIHIHIYDINPMNNNMNMNNHMNLNMNNQINNISNQCFLLNNIVSNDTKSNCSSENKNNTIEDNVTSNVQMLNSDLDEIEFIISNKANYLSDDNYSYLNGNNLFMG